MRVGEDFNVGARGYLQSGLELFLPYSRPISLVLCGLVLLGMVGWIARRPGVDSARRARSITLAFIVLLPTAVHPWYATWLVPFLALSPSAAGLWLIGALPLSYLKYGAADGKMPAWVGHVEWLPAYGLLLLEWRRGRSPVEEAG